MNEQIRKYTNWGIIGLGKIAHKFAADLQLLPNTKLHAVASQSLDRARAFAAQYHAKYAYGTYDEIVNCPELDVVYIATPHVLHCENTILCLRHRIPVLCEKPLAINLREAQKMILTAQQQQTFLMEAIWTRFMPTIDKTLRLIEQGVIGRVLSIKADFGFNAPFDPRGRIFNQQLGGGALLDIGVYPAFLALLIMGKPTGIKAFAKMSLSGVDQEIGAVLQYEDGRLAHLHANIAAKTKTEAFIYGEKGTIHLHTRWHEQTSMSLLLNDARPQNFHFDYKGKGYHYEATHVMDCLQSGALESTLLPLQFSNDLTTLLDNIRKEAGIVYPQDIY